MSKCILVSNDDIDEHWHGHRYLPLPLGPPSPLNFAQYYSHKNMQSNLSEMANFKRQCGRPQSGARGGVSPCGRIQTHWGRPKKCVDVING